MFIKRRVDVGRDMYYTQTHRHNIFIYIIHVHLISTRVVTMVFGRETYNLISLSGCRSFAEQTILSRLGTYILFYYRYIYIEEPTEIVCLPNSWHVWYSVHTPCTRI